MSLVSVSTPFNIDLDFEIAPFPKRVFAWCIDIVILLLYARGMKLFVEAAFVKEGADYPIGLDLLLVSMPMLFYNLLMEAAFQGQSMGKRLMGIRVISLEGGEPDIGQYLLRWIFRFWEWPLFFGFIEITSYIIYYQIIFSIVLGVAVVITIAITNKSQRLGDLAAGTTIVSIRNNYNLNDTVFLDVAQQDYKVLYPEVMRLSDRDINAVKSVINQSQKSQRYDTAHRVALKIKEVLGIQSDMDVMDFLEKLLADYNYLATKEA